MNKDAILTQEFKKRVLSSGIDLIGITSASPFTIREEAEKIVDPKDIFEDAQSVIVAGFYIYDKLNFLPSELGKPRGRFSYGVRVLTRMSTYCQKVIRQFLQERGFKTVSCKREEIPAKMAAVRAGLGKYGKNSVVLTEKFGSWVEFECLVSDAPLDYEEHPMDHSRCGKCEICIKACPTQAIYAPYKVNKARCITNWLWGAFAPINLREKQENRLFGCGECLKVCPKNKHLEPRENYPVSIENLSDNPELIPLATADSAYYRKVIPSFPRRAGIKAIRGNVIIALGNSGDPAAINVLEKTLHFPKPQIRAYSAWALGKIGGTRAVKILEEALLRERNPKVFEEIKDALRKIVVQNNEER